MELRLISRSSRGRQANNFLINPKTYFFVLAASLKSLHIAIMTPEHREKILLSAAIILALIAVVAFALYHQLNSCLAIRRLRASRKRHEADL